MDGQMQLRSSLDIPLVLRRAGSADEYERVRKETKGTLDE